MPDHPLETRIRDLEADNARLRRLLDDREMPAELRHRVRNTLALVRAVVRRSAETSATLDEYAAHLEGRLDAILRVQNAIAQSPPDGIDLHSMVADELLAHLAREGDQADLAGPKIYLRPKAAESFGLALHELAINAIKFGALTAANGRVAVTWKVSEDSGIEPVLHFRWEESGVPVAPAKASHRGFGSEVLERTLRYQIRADVDFAFNRDGIACDIRLPFPPQIGMVRHAREGTGAEPGDFGG
ncbi:sensor histidine kinase [Lichenifustis flavocetrariae]|uniref:histidine kinase n=1 Tax=Lichenifustis flavocetrariae TaxID=2949735 RepID=A0AA41YV24_9HYPH|nr:sensor histidine kinase [Lichenifustis flavocetrariae]MCW6509096.1 sensor histidine kinase [Lichenifustis flavocetrariae]